LSQSEGENFDQPVSSFIELSSYSSHKDKGPKVVPLKMQLSKKIIVSKLKPFQSTQINVPNEEDEADDESDINQFHYIPEDSSLNRTKFIPRKEHSIGAEELFPDTSVSGSNNCVVEPLATDDFLLNKKDIDFVIAKARKTYSPNPSPLIEPIPLYIPKPLPSFESPQFISTHDQTPG
jgi:hypothetical protein